ncbi:MAG TPA: HEAT repeat domain-containing protein [bacterium]|nr:HEAT repeat domain-containing protein [bacterium]
MRWFCGRCWRETSKETVVCPNCGASQHELADEPFVQKLIRSLHSPEPETPLRAAALLGELQAREAIPHLIEIVRTSRDHYLKAEVIRALGRIGGNEAVAVLSALSGRESGVIEKRAVQKALQTLGIVK